MSTDEYINKQVLDLCRRLPNGEQLTYQEVRERIDSCIAADRKDRKRREKIAIAAMQGFAGNPKTEGGDRFYKQLAESAVDAADALIAELDK